MSKNKTILYSLIMFATFVGELAFLIVALVTTNYLLFIGVGAFYLVQSGLGFYMLYDAAFNQHSESAYATMAFGNLFPFGQLLSGYFLYRVRKGE